MKGDIILAPVVTEKTNEMRERGQYVFRVHPGANKLEIIAAIRKMFDVHPTNCNVINVSRKPKRLRHRPGHTARWKKAILTLPAGESIPIFEGA